MIILSRPMRPLQHASQYKWIVQLVIPCASKYPQLDNRMLQGWIFLHNSQWKSKGVKIFFFLCVFQSPTLYDNLIIFRKKTLIKMIDRVTLRRTTFQLVPPQVSYSFAYTSTFAQISLNIFFSLFFLFFFQFIHNALISNSE